MANFIQNPDGSVTLNGQTYSADQAKQYFSTHDANQVAADASSLGLNAAQTAMAQESGGIRDPSKVNYSAIAAANPGGQWINGMYATPEQTKNFYAQGGNDVQYLEQNGITDLSKIHQMAGQSRDIAGNNPMGGEAGLQKYFQQYQQYNPNGKAKTYQDFVGALSPTARTAMEAGAFTGVPTIGEDSNFTGIYGPGSSYYGQSGYGSGLGPRGMGDLGGGWQAQGSTSPVAATGKYNTSTTTPMNGDQFAAMYPNGGVMPNGASVSGQSFPLSSGITQPQSTPGFQSSSQPMAGQITGMLNQGLQYGLGSGLSPSPAQTPSTPAQSVSDNISQLLGNSGNVANPTAAEITNTPIPGQSNVPNVGPADQAVAQTSAMNQNQATTPIQKFQSLVSSIPVGNPTAFGKNAQITKRPDGSIMVTGPSLNKPYMLDGSMPQDQLMQQLQAIYSMANAPPSGAPA